MDKIAKIAELLLDAFNDGGEPPESLMRTLNMEWGVEATEDDIQAAMGGLRDWFAILQKRFDA